MQIPILILAFNRPNHTAKLVDALRKVQPERIFVSCDGPRKNVESDTEKTEAVRSLLRTLDWPCEISFNFLEENCGCRKAVTLGIDWFFNQVEEGIILEDDCIPTVPFFHYAALMLEKYRDAPQVMHISGHTATPHIFGSEAYGFSNMPQVWGWASWRRAWKCNDAQLVTFSQENTQKAVRHLTAFPPAQKYISEKFEDTKAGKINTWDYIWFYSILNKKGLCVTPNVPMIENIGFDEEATHTFNKKTQIHTVSYDLRAVDFSKTNPPLRVSAWIEFRIFTAVQKSFGGLLYRYFFTRS